MTALQLLNLSTNPIKSLPATLANLARLKELNMASTDLESLPSAVARMPLDILQLENTPYATEQHVEPEDTNEKEEETEDNEHKKLPSNGGGCLGSILAVAVVVLACVAYLYFSGTI